MSDVKAWAKVISLGVLKLPFKAAAPFVVPFLSRVDRIGHPIWGVYDATDTSWWNIGVRNSIHNLMTIPMPKFETWSNSYDHTLEELDCFQWRYRRSIDGKYVSFRCTWGKPRPKKGKREFYVGWVMNDGPYARLTFFQFRPF